MGVIYKITAPGKRIYVGQTVNYDNRLKRYRWKACKKQRMLYNSFLKYGFDSHVFEILEDNILPENLNEREKFWIKKCDSFYKNNRKGMNLNEGGNTPIWDRQRIENFSDKFKGSKNPFFGKKHTPETLKILSENSKAQLKKSGYKISLASSLKGAAAKRKEIIVYNNKGEFIAEYPSLTSFAISINMDVTTVRDVLKGIGCIKGMYFLKYKTDNYLLNIEVGEVTIVNRNVLCFIGNNTLEYKSVKYAADDLNIPKQTIRHAALNYGFKSTKSGHIFIYKDLYEQQLKKVS